jgi:hypothetical protein
MMKMGGPVVQARNFAVMTGVNAGVLAFMKRWRGKDDVQNSLAGAGGGWLRCLLLLLPGRQLGASRLLHS